MRLQNKVAIVTGGTSGIGLACVKDFLEEGAKVVVTGSREAFDKIGELGENARYIKCDVSKEEEVINLVNKTLGMFGKLDILVSNAGIGDGAALADEPTETWDNIISINLRGVFLTNK